MKKIFASTLSLQGLELKIHLGWSRAEQLKKQVVVLDVDIFFTTPPIACTTDILQDTLCYDNLVKNIKKDLAKKKFRLIENLGYSLVQIIKKSLPKDAGVSIKVKKQPGISNLTGGVSFSYGEM